MDVNAEAQTFAQHFAAIGTAERAESEKAYLKSELRFYGATVPQIRQAARAFKKAHPRLERTDLVALVRCLWSSDYHELRAVGIALLELYVARLEAEDMALLEALLGASHTWAHVDWLACKVAGPLVARFQSTQPTLRRWAKSPNFWLRRAAMLALNDELRAGRGNFELFAQFAAPMLEEREFFIRKAIGWVLRETSKKHPQLTYEFLMRYRDRVSGLTLREGAKNLSAQQRRELGLPQRRGGVT